MITIFPIKAENNPKIKSIRTDVYARFTDFSPILGNSAGKIVDIEQDKYGYIWLAGTKCLSRFDGNIIKHYVNDWTPESLPSSKVYCIETDYFGRLWVGTENGLCYYDYNNDDFIKIFGPDTTKNPSDTFYIREILAEGDSLLWINTQQGYLWKVDINTLEVLKQYKHPYTDQPYYYYNSVFRDDDKKIWLGGRGQGPFILNEKNGKLKNFPKSNYIDIPGIKRGDDIAYFNIDSKGNFWIGSTDGIYLYNKNDSSFNMFYKTSSWAMIEDHLGDLWFAIANGLGHYHHENGEMIFYLPNEEDNESLIGSYIYDVFEDNYNQIWVASARGVSVYKPETPGVQYLFHIPGIQETPISSSISALSQDEKGIVWIGTSENGIDSYDPEEYAITHFNTKNTKGLPSGKIRSITISPDGNIYCGLWAGLGFGFLDPDNNKFTLYSYNKNNTTVDWYNDMVFDNYGNLYLGFWGADGLTMFDPLKGKFGKSLKNKFRMTYFTRLITCLEMDKYDNLWMGTTLSGLHLYLPESDTSICFYSQINPDIGIDEKKIYDIQKDESGNIWIGAEGLYYASAEKQKVDKIILNEENEEIEIFGLLAENEFSVWLMTGNGLLKYNRQSNSITDYSSTVNLSFFENNASGIKLKDGRLMFAGINGIAIVEPKNIRLGKQMPEVFLSSLFVFDKVKITNLENKELVELNYKENFFTIQIGSNVWGRNNPFKLFYKLEGFNKDWIEIPSSDREARFTNVQPGEYYFKVKVEDKQGNKLSNAASCVISITPPLWVRWWFVTLIILAILSIISIFWWSRLKSMQLSLFNSELNQKLLRLQMNPHFIFNSLFAIQNFIYSNQPNLAGNYLSDFAYLIRLILDNSRKENISFEKELETIELYLKLQKLRFEDKFDYSIEIDSELQNGDYLIPPMLAQPFLENAIEHGLKNLDKKGYLNIKYQLSGGIIRFIVIDNGIGLTASRQQKEEAEQKHESLAISICTKRLEILRKKKGGKITFTLEEIKNADGSVAGTKVAFNIPY